MLACSQTRISSLEIVERAYENCGVFIDFKCKGESHACLLDDFRREKEKNVCAQARVMYAKRSNVCISREIFVCL